MTEATVECFNCGRENPGWAQICRSCGVSLRGASRWSSGPPPRFPTDRNSLMSMGTAIATILVALVVGLILSNLDPNRATAGGGPTPSPTPRPATPTPEATATPEPTPSPTPALLGTLSLGTGIGPDGAVTGPTDSFGPGDNFAYSLSVPEPIGAPEIMVEVIRLEADGTETQVQEPSGQAVDASAQVAAFQVPAQALITGFGTGDFVMRIYRADELIAQGAFELTA